MDRRSLTRLRIAFLLLGAALLLPLGLLLRSVDARLEAQRRLRHELVAERIFDEMEGELTALLAREDARPSAAYGDTSTRVENWAPFVVGYFRRDAHGLQIVAKPQLAAERVRRLEAVLKPAARDVRDQAGGFEPALGAGATMDAEITPAAAKSAADTARPAKAHELEEQRKAASYEAKKRDSAASSKGFGDVAAPAAAAQKVQAAPEAVLKQLNRSVDMREREAPRSKHKAAVSRDDTDPLAGME